MTEAPIEAMSIHDRVERLEDAAKNHADAIRALDSVLADIRKVLAHTRSETVVNGFTEDIEDA